jgi:hypothetical protein
MVERLAFLLDGVPEAERMARCRELRALSLVYLGLDHPVTMALAAAVTDPAAGAAHAVSAIISAPCVMSGSSPASLTMLARAPVPLSSARARRLYLDDLCEHLPHGYRNCAG